MEKLTIGIRTTLGLIFIIMGLNGFFHFMSFDMSTSSGKAFINALNEAHFFWPLEKTIEVVSGLLLLFNKWTALAVEMLAPIIINIMLFHIFLEPEGLALAILVFILEAFLIKKYWKDHFRHLFEN
jgi:hypothetical protein